MEDGSLVAHVLLHVLYCDKTVSVTMADEEFDGDLEGSVSSSWCGLLLPRLARCANAFHDCCSISQSSYSNVIHLHEDLLVCRLVWPSKEHEGVEGAWRSA